MSRRRQNAPDIASMLNEGHFGGPSAELPSADPVTTVQMTLSIRQIKSYDRNPRHERNPRYDEIKASIRAQRRLNNSLEVTRRPGDEHYMIRAGGNTRLQILHELLEETGDTAFEQVHCLFHPWTSEADVLTAHLVENELRGDMTLIDKALGLVDLKRTLEEEDETPMSRSEFARRLGELGYSISRRQMIRLEYAAEMLYPVIPTALRAGLGRSQVDQLKAFQQAFCNYWENAGDNPDRATSTFLDVLSGLDEPDLDMTAVVHGMEALTAELLEHPIRRVRMEVDALLARRPNSTASTAPPPSSGAFPVDPPEGEQTELREDPTAPAPAAPDEDNASPSPGQERPGRMPPPAPGERQQAPSAQTPGQNSADQPHDLPPRPEYQGPSDLKSLRSRAAVLALQLAKRYGLDECIMPTPANGMGYLVDLPSQPFGDTRVDALKRWTWWSLFSASEINAETIRMAEIPPGYMTRGPQAGQIVQRPDWDRVAGHYLHSPEVDDRDFELLVQLWSTGRMIRRLAEDPAGNDLWELPSDERI